MTTPTWKQWRWRRVARTAAVVGVVALALSAAADGPDWFETEPRGGPQLGSVLFPGESGRLLEDVLNIARAHPNPTMNVPYYWAWKTFVSINRPVKVSGSPKGRRPPYWETWASDGETFPSCPDPNQPPPWPGNAYRLKRLGPRVQAIIHSDGPKPILTWYVLQNGVPVAITDVTDPQEVRRNKASFDYITGKGLYYTEGLAAAFQRARTAVAATDGSTAQAMAAVLRVVDFPIEAIEMKADWIPVTDIPPAQRSQFYRNVAVTVDANGQETGAEYALVAMHIMTKQVPFWFWATWLNKNVLGRCDYIGCRDDFGLTPSYIAPNAEPNYPYPDGQLTPSLRTLMKLGGLDPVFQNYRLIGIQTDFTDPTGQPVLMSNTITEQGQLQTGSCMTCHSRAAVTASGALLSITSSTAQNETPPPGDRFVTDNGTPNPSWFWTLENNTPYTSSSTRVTELVAAQLDFVWGFLLAHPASTCSPRR